MAAAFCASLPSIVWYTSTLVPAATASSGSSGFGLKTTATMPSFSSPSDADEDEEEDADAEAAAKASVQRATQRPVSISQRRTSPSAAPEASH